MSNKNDDQDSIDVSNIMRTEGGRRFMTRQLEFCRVSESVFDSDPIKHAHNAGLRKAGLQLERELKAADFSLYLKMLGENHGG